MLRTNGLKCPKLEIHFTSHDRSQTKKSIQKLETWNSGDGDGDRGKKIRTQGLDSGLLAQAKNEQMLRWIQTLKLLHIKGVQMYIHLF